MNKKNVDICLGPRIKKSLSRFKVVWCDKERSAEMSVKDIANDYRNNLSFDIDLSYKGKHTNVYSAETSIFNLIQQVELYNSSIDTSYTRRIIEKGGMFKYAQSLEKQLGIENE